MRCVVPSRPLLPNSCRALPPDGTISCVKDVLGPFVNDVLGLNSGATPLERAAQVPRTSERCEDIFRQLFLSGGGARAPEGLVALGCARITKTLRPSPEEITQWLVAWSNGDPLAVDRLMPLVYSELHRIAKRYMERENPSHTLQ